MPEKALSYLNIKFAIPVFIIFLFTGCSWSGAPFTPSGPTSVKPNNSPAVQRATMRPYTINGKTYYPTVVSVGDRASGIASWYGPNFHGKKTSNGEIYNMHNMTAAHKTLPMNTVLKVVNLINQKNVIVRINDRGPFVGDRVIDLSKAAATKLDMIAAGTAPVSMEVIGFNAQTMTVPVQTQSPKQQQTGVSISAQQSFIGGEFMVQIGAFKNQSGANRYQQKHRSIDGYKSVVKSFMLDGETIYRVFLSGFRSEDEARDYARSGKFVGAFIVRG
ncbi:septal ring lytic transglycosylase RlpA family protein [Campylobacter sp. RM12920]|uniref:Probable endolytic peptidoglycan transglycosylase RlpA n=1 Tax=Campylobacter californiensis TaxID=1032243 RepID=A0ABD4JJN8_9BACT|nr:septal ring lytic transglycosylase RlpA family protein [Campylobacter sp. RM12919]MBE2987788.1 septal ring lytic transglycosylase RlpA family protein [Campylobacter sp. RM12920]